MKTKMTPIVSWSIWAGGLSLVLGFVTRRHVIAGFASDETGMSYVIAALFAAGLVVSFLSARSLHKEWRILRGIKATDAIPQSRGQTDICAVFRKLDEYKGKGESVDIHTAIDTYHSKHNSRVRSVSIMAALVISMGLLGTVVGLIMSISGLGAVVENIGLSRTDMMAALQATVAGMGTAFYTTFFGALGGLILRAVAVSQLNSLSELCSEAAEYAAKNLVVKAESKEEALNQQLAKVISSFENMQHEMDALTGRIAASIETTLGQFGESIRTVGEHAVESTQAAVTGMTAQLEAVGASAQESMGALNAVVVQSSQELGESFGGLNAVLAEAGGRVNESFDGLGDSVQQASESVSGSLADFKLSIDGTTAELNDAVGELHTSIVQATGEMVTMAQAKLDTDATEIAGHLSVAATSIQAFLAHKAASSGKEESQRVA